MGRRGRGALMATPFLAFFSVYLRLSVVDISVGFSGLLVGGWESLCCWFVCCISARPLVFGFGYVCEGL